MAALFRDFSFSAASRHPSQIDLLHEPDPTAPSYPDSRPTSIPSIAEYTIMPPTHFSFTSSSSMAELQDSFSKHRISNTSPQNTHLPSTYFDCFRTPQYSPDLSLHPSEDSQYLISPHNHTSTFSSSAHLARRLQRQHTSRLQCTPAHLSKLSSLLEAMVEREDQCYAHSAATSASHSSASSDAGDTETVLQNEPQQTRGRRSSDSDLLHGSELRYRRSGDVLREGACVVKSVRVRKRGAERRKRVSR